LKPPSFQPFALYEVAISAKSAKLMNFSDSFHFAGLADCADYNHFTDFVKVKM
jgi:hypothetical protein